VKSKTIIEYAVIIVAAVLLALAIQGFLVKPYRIPSPSMVSTLLPGDRVLVDRVGYHFSPPSRGDIVVFNSVQAGQDAPGALPYLTLIKRIVGLPGETVSLEDGHVLIDGVRLDEPYIHKGADGVPDPTNPFIRGTPWSLEEPFTLGPDEYFMMGDNRTMSEDSRGWGPMYSHEIIGKAFFMYWPITRFGVL